MLSFRRLCGVALIAASVVAIVTSSVLYRKTAIQKQVVERIVASPGYARYYPAGHHAKHRSSRAVIGDYWEPPYWLKKETGPDIWYPVTDVGLWGIKDDDDMASHLANLSRLEVLEIFESELTEDGFREFARLKSLRVFRLHGDVISEIAIRQFRELLPDCDVKCTSGPMPALAH